MNNNPKRPANNRSANNRPARGSPVRNAPPAQSPDPRTRPRPDPSQMTDEEYARYQAWLAQKRARQVGQGTRLASQVSGRCGSWRLANHLPMQVRHHMGRQ